VEIFDPTRTPKRFSDAIRELSPTADLVYYSGHSSFGSAVKRLSDLVAFMPGKYQIYFIDSCSTFFYSGHFVLWKRVQEANPGMEPSQLVHFILNADEMRVRGGGGSLVPVIQGLLSGRETYREILARLDPGPRAIAIGSGDT
jgi:hypothetical protein